MAKGDRCYNHLEIGTFIQEITLGNANVLQYIAQNLLTTPQRYL